LASKVIDDIRRSSDTTCVFFHCKYGDPTRNSFVSMARSLLTQALHQAPDLLSYYYQMASNTDPVALTTVRTARQMLDVVLSSLVQLRIVVDGLDECKLEDRNTILSWLCTVVPSELGVRCFVTSQADKEVRKYLRHFIVIDMERENFDDLRRFCGVRVQQIETKFSDLRKRVKDLASLIFARAEGLIDPQSFGTQG
jgi:hypothetical protein